jgi:putative aldouronate transport system substrate-binding protein
VDYANRDIGGRARRIIRGHVARSALVALVTGIVLLSCGETEDLAYTNPDWREGVADTVTFPLPDPITLTVGLAKRMEAPSAENAGLQWLEDATNITLEFIHIPSSPGDIQFGEMIRAGDMPDIMAEERVDVDDDSIHRLFVDFLEFPHLVPNYAGLVRARDPVRAAALARLTADDRLLSMGTYDPGASPFVGVLAHRQDVFDELALSAATWDQVRSSMRGIAAAYPDSHPFGGDFKSILAFLPSWFGSGYDPRHIVYYDTGARRWKFGPFDDGFETFVRFLSESYAEGLLDPNIVSGPEDALTRGFTNDIVFLAPYRGATGPYFQMASGNYGEVTDSGEWNGVGSWVSPLPLPPAPNGEPRWISTRRYSPTGPGWLVYNQGDYVGEAIALLDYLFTEEAALSLALGPEGAAWGRTEERVVLNEGIASAYAEGGTRGLHSALVERDIVVGIPLAGWELDFYSTFGYPEIPALQYHVSEDLSANTPGEEVMVEVGVRIPTDDMEFSDARVSAVVTLQSHVESQVAGFVVGRRPLSEYEQFVEECIDMGAERLVELYNDRATVPSEDVLAPLLTAGRPE